MNDGKLVRVPVPALTEERRKDMVKHLHRILEEHRTACATSAATATTPSRRR
jgi:ribosome recycling factor